MNATKLGVLVLSGSILSGCGAFVPVVNIKDLPPEKKHALRAIPIYNSVQLIDKDFQVLNILEGNACQNKLYDPPATRTAAIEQLKYHALEAGANGITNIQCGAREGTSTRTNCWELISCTAEAIKVNGKRYKVLNRPGF